MQVGRKGGAGREEGRKVKVGRNVPTGGREEGRKEGGRKEGEARKVKQGR